MSDVKKLSWQPPQFGEKARAAAAFIKSLQPGMAVEFTRGAQKFAGVVHEVAPEYFIIGHPENPKDVARQWIFYKAKDYGNITPGHSN